MSGFLKNRAGSVLADNKATRLKDTFDAEGTSGLDPSLQKNINIGSSDEYTKQVGAVLGTGYDAVAADYQPGESENRPMRMLDNSTRHPTSQRWIKRS